jgi:formylglycine-generating enzyme required for sulfatase activity/tRNA A-37 threonylcarbamoyl transferase component Bud32
VANAPEDAAERIAAAFAIAYLEDAAEGRVRTLEQYQALHPGHEDLIAREWARLAATTRTADGPDLPERGRAFGPYRIDGEIARGGQAIVFEAFDPRVGRKVVVKVLRAQASVSESAIRRIRMEATILAGLDHPAICPVYDAGIEDGRPYLVLKLVDGTSLAARLAAHREAGEGPSAADVATAVRFVEEIARALHQAHERGIVHRDFKPGNVMVTPEGRPVVLDFGLARILDADTPRLTRTGDVVGTPAYLAPEQIAGDPARVDRRADVHALGLVLAEMITLERAFAAESHEELLRQIRERPLSDPRRLNPAVTRDLALVVATATSKDPELRYRTALDLAEDLRRVAAGEPVVVRRAGAFAKAASFARRNPAAALVMVLVPLVLSAAILVTLRERSRITDARQFLEARTAEADRAAREANERLAALRRMDDLVRLEELVAEARLLHPAGPALVPRLERWLASAAAIVTRLPGHRAQRDALRARARTVERADPGGASGGDDPDALLARLDRTSGAIAAERLRGPDSGRAFRLDVLEKESAAARAALEASGAGAPAVVLPTPEEQWLYDNLDRLVRGVEALEGAGGLIAKERAILEASRVLAARTIEAHRAAWESAALAVAQDPRFGGLGLEPQMGLVPLGADPASGLQEFAHFPTGSVPARDPSGRLVLEEDSGIVLVLLPGGAFWMGAEVLGTESRPGDSDAQPLERPVHRVTLHPFFMGKHEMTQAQWLRWTGKNPSFFAPPGRGASHRPTLLCPVEQVDFFESERVLFEMGLILPTEAQWEYAARGGTTTPWWTGADSSSGVGACNVSDEFLRTHPLQTTRLFEEFNDGWSGPAPLGTFRENPFGMDGMIGNVAEWCRDRWAHYGVPALPGDGLRASVGDDGRAVRDGGWFWPMGGSRPASRYRVLTRTAGNMIGLRPARALDRS